MKILSWQRFDLGLRLVLCSGPMLVCVFSLAEFPGSSGWWMLASGTGAIVSMLVCPGVAIITTRSAVWFVAVPFWPVRIRLLDVASVASVEVRPFEDFGGWGVKGASRRAGLLLAANGERAVRITRRNGQTFLATTDDAEQTTAAIEGLLAPAP